MRRATIVRFGLPFVFLLLLLLSSESLSRQYVVRSTADAGAHSLRWAILQANASEGPDVISFEIPGKGPFSITPSSPLPALTDPAGVVIDGLSQPGARSGEHPPATLELLIVLDGVHAGACPGLWILSSNNLVQGLVITRFQQDGIRIQGTAAGTRDNNVRNCIVGLDPSGTDARPNCSVENGERYAGISIVAVPKAPGNAHDNSIFGCLVSGNSGDGVKFADCQGASVYRNTIRQCFVGTTRSGDVVRGNARDGILVYGGSHNNTVSENLIGGNGSDGVHVVGTLERDAPVFGNTITRNYIGITREHRAIGNNINGINIGGREYESQGGYAVRNTVSTNTIAANHRSGIIVWEHPSSASNADGNRLTQNNVFMNGRIGIDLGDDGVTLNDVADTDEGPNQNRNTAVILSADINNGLVLLRGNVDLGSLRPNAIVEIYKTHSTPLQQYRGSLYLGTVSPDADGNWGYSTNGGLFAGDSVTALVIDADGNTSEFARQRAVTPGDVFREEENDEIADENKLQNKAGATIASTVQDPRSGMVEFTLDVENPCWCILEIYTAKDELVHTVVNRWIPSGRQTVTWDGRNWKGDLVPPGSYTCKLDAGGMRQTTTLSRRLGGVNQ